MATRKKYEVIVVGGGVAGIAAAVTASKAGAKVALIEKNIILGGLAGSGFVNIFLPLCDGCGNQIIYGEAETFLNLSIKYGPGMIPPGWGKNPGKKISRYMTHFSSASFSLALAEYIQGFDIDIWYDTIVTDAIKDGDNLIGVKVFNKSGHNELFSDYTIDATGDADVAKFADAPLLFGKSFFSSWSLNTSLGIAESTLKYEDSDFLLSTLKLGASEGGNDDFNGDSYLGISGKIVSSYVRTSQNKLLEFYSDQSKNKNSAFPLAFPNLPQLRTTRRILGRDMILSSNCNIKIDDSVGRIPSWKEVGKVWDIPKGALIPRGIEKLIVAGRIISAEEGDALEAARSIPAAALTGEIAGEMVMELISSDK